METPLKTMLEFDARITDIIQRTQDIKSFRFAVEEGVTFKPGQFFSVAIDIDGGRQSKYFSFSNSPTEKGYVEFTKRITQSPFSQTLDKFKPGDTARLKLPYGNFTFEGEYKKIAMLSGGIGITPLRSMCKYIVDKNLDTDLVLIYGNRTDSDIAFMDEFDSIAAAAPKMKVIYTLTSQDVDKKCLGRRGHIDDKMIAEEIPDYKERVFFICGPPLMVKCLIELLEDRLSIPKENIKRENFAGY